MSLVFPTSPSNGEEYQGYVYDSTDNVWNRLPNNPEFVRFSETAPSNPQEGTLWFNTTVGKMFVYYNDGSSSQWVSAIGGINNIQSTDLPTGTILQVVQSNTSTTTTTTSTNFVDTALTGSITPTSSSSKILVTATIAAFNANNGGGSSAMTIFRGNASTGTDLTGVESPGNRMAVHYSGGSVSNAVPASMQALDSPATSSLVTYTVGIRTTNSANTATASVYQNMILMEISA